MCCRISVTPIDRDIARAVLTLGHFVEDSPSSWHRDVAEDDGTEARVWAELQPDMLIVRLTPSVSTLEGHHHKRNSAGVMFEIGARYRDKVGGALRQTGINVPHCQASVGAMERLLSDGSEVGGMVLFDRVCPGWQAVFLGEATL